MQPVRKFREGFDKVKCKFCREARQKCEPSERLWPGEKCHRCRERNLKCSEGQRPGCTSRYAKKPTNPMSDLSPALSQLLPRISPALVNHHVTYLVKDPSLRSTQDAVTQLKLPTSLITLKEDLEQSRHALIILSLKITVEMALEELKILADDMTSHCRNDPNGLSPVDSTPGLRNTFAEYKAFSHILQEVISSSGRTQVLQDALFTLRGDYGNAKTTWTADEDGLQRGEMAILYWQEIGYLGFAHVLQMRRLLDHPELGGSEAIRLIQCRESFLGELGAIVQQYNLKQKAPMALQGSQGFIPSKLLRIPNVAEHFINVGLPDCLGRTFSHVLSDAGNLVVWPVEHVKYVDVLGRSALYFACKSGETALVQHHLEFGADPAQVAVNGLTPFHIAASMGEDVICSHIWYHRNGCDDKIEKYNTYRDGTGRTPFMWAAWSGHEPTVRFFRERLHSLTERDIYQGTPCSLAASRGHHHIVKYLLRDMIPFDMPDINGRTPFWFAAQRSHCGIMACLNKRGAAIDRKDKFGVSPFAEAARQGHTDVLDYLLSLNDNTPVRRLQDIHNATYSNTPTDQRVNINSQDSQGRTPLVLATEARQAQCIKLLLEHDRMLLPIANIKQAMAIADSNNDRETVNVFRTEFSVYGGLWIH